ncbi:hypothetical protein [Methanosarcina siciliae]|uniref:hypothetical protein n=1 Tax=Methanosarcina siciliae TaxID=38027 RepID=UPI0018CE14F0|nr:hypothetical protein [Methanosarcina siciliae]
MNLNIKRRTMMAVIAAVMVIASIGISFAASDWGTLVGSFEFNGITVDGILFKLSGKLFSLNSVHFFLG